jgi:hypothetical protein
MFLKILAKYDAKFTSAKLNELLLPIFRVLLISIIPKFYNLR